jgi:excisionase family DNA binding protein
MSSNIRIQRICQHCQKPFEARTTVTRYCGDNCAKRAYKSRMREGKIEASQYAMQLLIPNSIERLREKEYLSITDTCKLLDVSRWTVWRLIKKGELPAAKFGARTLLKRSDLDNIFVTVLPPVPYKNELTVESEPSDCYSLSEVKELYGISDKALYSLIKRNNIPQYQLKQKTCVPKSAIENIFGEPLATINNDEGKTTK